MQKPSTFNQRAELLHALLDVMPNDIINIISDYAKLPCMVCGHPCENCKRREINFKGLSVAGYPFESVCSVCGHACKNCKGRQINAKSHQHSYIAGIDTEGDTIDDPICVSEAYPWEHYLVYDDIHTEIVPLTAVEVVEAPVQRTSSLSASESS
jgi:hypothetical protein